VEATLGIFYFISRERKEVLGFRMEQRKGRGVRGVEQREGRVLGFGF